MKKIILIEDKLDFNLINEHYSGEEKVVLLNYDFEDELRQRVNEYSTINDYVDMDDLLDLFLRVFRDLEGWYDESNVKEFLREKNGVHENIGLILNKTVSDAYFIVINYVYLIDRILEVEKADGFVCGDITDRNDPIRLAHVLETLYSQYLNIEVVRLKEDKNKAVVVSKDSLSFKTKLMEIASKCSFVRKDMHKRSVLLVGDFEKLGELVKPLKNHVNLYFLSDAINLKQYIFLLWNGGKYLSRKTAGAVKENHDTEGFDVEDFLRSFENNVDILVKGINVAPLIAKYLSCKIGEFNEDILSEYRRCENVISRFNRNDKVFLDEEVSINSRIITMLAKKKGLISEVIVHGYINHSMGFLPSICKRMHVWNQWQKTAIGEFGGDITKVGVSGCLKYGKAKKIKPEIFAKKKNEKFIILFAPTALNKRRAFNIWYYMDYFNLFFDEVRRLSSEMPLEVLLKFHPGDSNSSRIRRLIKEKELSDIVVELPTKANAFDAIKKADLLVSMYSTMIVDALYLNRPVVNLGTPQYKIFEDLERFKSGMVSTIEKPEDLHRKICSVMAGSGTAMSESEYSLFAEKFINISPVHPAQKILDQDFLKT
ncbi:MAG: CDP-glycerol glycerophosphotransferase family protein [Candidatus Aadella gelida]|nr:CDP-glycerol glycerophosphotransferase family protein [Candidatus Aadella gelida]